MEATLQEFSQVIGAYVPNLIGALAILVVGWLAARILAAVTRSALHRTKRRGLLRNVAVALGNSQNPRAIAPLCTALQDPEPLIRSHAAWALGEFHDASARTALQRQFSQEHDSQVKTEILVALGEKEPLV